MKIESGIPLPDTGIRSVYAQTLERMKAGDSVLFDTEKEADALRGAGIYRGYKMKKHKSEEGWRVWLLERGARQKRKRRAATVIPLVTPRKSG